MKHSAFLSKLDHLRQEKSIWFGVSLLLLLGNLGLILSHLFKDERVILLPAHVSEECWVKRGHVSKSYLEQIGWQFAKLILDLRPESAEFQFEQLSKYLTPEATETIRTFFLAEGKRLQKENLYVSFWPKSLSADPHHMTVEIKGQLSTFVADKRVSDEEKIYSLRFSYEGGFLKLEHFQEKEDKK